MAENLGAESDEDAGKKPAVSVVIDEDDPHLEQSAENDQSEITSTTVEEIPSHLLEDHNYMGVGSAGRSASTWSSSVYDENNQPFPVLEGLESYITESDSDVDLQQHQQQQLQAHQRQSPQQQYYGASMRAVEPRRIRADPQSGRVMPMVINSHSNIRNVRQVFKDGAGYGQAPVQARPISSGPNILPTVFNQRAGGATRIMRQSDYAGGQIQRGSPMSGSAYGAARFGASPSPHPRAIISSSTSSSAASNGGYGPSNAAVLANDPSRVANDNAPAPLVVSSRGVKPIQRTRVGMPARMPAIGAPQSSTFSPLPRKLHQATRTGSGSEYSLSDNMHSYAKIPHSYEGYAPSGGQYGLSAHAKEARSRERTSLGDAGDSSTTIVDVVAEEEAQNAKFFQRQSNILAKRRTPSFNESADGQHHALAKNSSKEQILVVDSPPHHHQHQQQQQQHIAQPSPHIIGGTPIRTTSPRFRSVDSGSSLGSSGGVPSQRHRLLSASQMAEYNRGTMPMDLSAQPGYYAVSPDAQNIFATKQAQRPRGRPRGSRTTSVGSQSALARQQHRQQKLQQQQQQQQQQQMHHHSQQQQRTVFPHDVGIVSYAGPNALHSSGEGVGSSTGEIVDPVSTDFHARAIDEQISSSSQEQQLQQARQQLQSPQALAQHPLQQQQHAHPYVYHHPHHSQMVGQSTTMEPLQMRQAPSHMLEQQQQATLVEPYSVGGCVPPEFSHADAQILQHQQHLERQQMQQQQQQQQQHLPSQQQYQSLEDLAELAQLSQQQHFIPFVQQRQAFAGPGTPLKAPPQAEEAHQQRAEKPKRKSAVRKESKKKAMDEPKRKKASGDETTTTTKQPQAKKKPPKSEAKKPLVTMSSSKRGATDEYDDNEDEDGDDDEYGDYTTRCLCGMTHNDDFMIQCDKCDVWQHGVCMDVSPKNPPSNYFCELCEPRTLKHTKQHAAFIQKRVLARIEDNKRYSRNSKQNEKKSGGAGAKPKLKFKLKEKEAQAKRSISPKKSGALKNFNETAENQYSRGVRALVQQITLLGDANLLKSLKSQGNVARQMFVASNVEGLVAALLDHDSTIAEGAPVIEYIGHFHMASESSAGSKAPSPKNNFALRYCGFGDDNAIIVDASKGGSSARFARRSCRPNTSIQHVICEGRLHLLLIASETIVFSQEITIPFDYDFTKSQVPVSCACGSTDEQFGRENPTDCVVYKFNQALAMTNAAVSVKKSEEKKPQVTPPRRITQSPVKTKETTTAQVKPVEKREAEKKDEKKEVEKEAEKASPTVRRSNRTGTNSSADAPKLSREERKLQEASGIITRMEQRQKHMEDRKSVLERGKRKSTSTSKFSVEKRAKEDASSSSSPLSASLSLAYASTTPTTIAKRSSLRLLSTSSASSSTSSTVANARGTPRRVTVVEPSSKRGLTSIKTPKRTLTAITDNEASPLKKKRANDEKQISHAEAAQLLTEMASGINSEPTDDLKKDLRSKIAQVAEIALRGGGDKTAASSLCADDFLLAKDFRVFSEMGKRPAARLAETTTTAAADEKAPSTSPTRTQRARDTASKQAESTTTEPGTKLQKMISAGLRSPRRKLSESQRPDVADGHLTTTTLTTRILHVRSPPIQPTVAEAVAADSSDKVATAPATSTVDGNDGIGSSPPAAPDSTPTSAGGDNSLVVVPITSTVVTKSVKKLTLAEYKKRQSSSSTLAVSPTDARQLRSTPSKPQRGFMPNFREVSTTSSMASLLEPNLSPRSVILSAIPTSSNRINNYESGGLKSPPRMSAQSSVAAIRDDAPSIDELKRRIYGGKNAPAKEAPAPATPCSSVSTPSSTVSQPRISLEERLQRQFGLGRSDAGAGNNNTPLRTPSASHTQFGGVVVTDGTHSSTSLRYGTTMRPITRVRASPQQQQQHEDLLVPPPPPPPPLSTQNVGNIGGNAGGSASRRYYHS